MEKSDKFSGNAFLSKGLPGGGQNYGICATKKWHAK